MMVISRTPFRVSLGGGGSDFREYYRLKGGTVVSMAIDRYMYVTVNRRFDDRIRVSYTRTEIVDKVDDLEHELIREAMKRVGLTSSVEVTTIADLPAGIGLGSSSTLTVGVLNALYAMRGIWASPADLARGACEIEIDVLGHPIGKQDQYIAAFGGLQYLRFEPDESVIVHPVVCDLEIRRQVVENLMLFFTGVSRQAGSVLVEAKARMATKGGEGRRPIDGLNAQAEVVRTALITGKPDAIGTVLNDSWALKKQMASNVSNVRLDEMYEAAMAAGARGGKVSGAGGGGCLLLYVKPRRQRAVRQALLGLGVKEVPVEFEPGGSRIIHFGR